MRFFNDFVEVRKTGGKLPHWEQPGATYFLTWRLADSIPPELMGKWSAERDAWLLEHPKPWEADLEEEYHRVFSMEIKRLMDKGHGSCVLRQEKMRRIVGESFRSADGRRYDLHAFVIMPNHVHLLLSLAEKESLGKVVGGWKKYTARRINVILGENGKLWQKVIFSWERIRVNLEKIAANGEAGFCHGRLQCTASCGEVAAEQGYGISRTEECLAENLRGGAGWRCRTVGRARS